ncbi:sodium:calcium antiporter [Psychromarinibacter sp. C21-152]|uniref:Sodium:calcium antiporter n=1 Tax=Psychromarinibacter sediminicola TaxID=3033385 RepID=A0AAE3NU14_9RHOB|nr:sodium:calcium antiporter [Psychromarinibacter sediminicola]MDF0602037.1 sodium:calcium antiporter [Psychromarinibacter sediminicola]
MISELSNPWIFGLFALAGLAILVLGTRITGLADRIADRTGLGEAVIGGIVLGAATSLSGTVVSVTAAVQGAPELAFANGIGGIAAQTAFLALADVIYRKANLEHTAAEATNLFQGAVLICLLSMPLTAWLAPDFAIWQVHPVSVLLIAAYCIGAVTTKTVREEPMWEPVETSDTRADTPDEPQSRKGAVVLVGSFTLLVACLGLAGWVIAETGSELSGRFGLSQTVVGALMTAVVTSLPELVTTIAAVRRGAMQLAVGGIIGGNTFDTLFLSLSDMAYRDGSLYHAVGQDGYFWLAVGMLMTAILLIGLVLRERRGPLSIGWESLAMLVVYGGAVVLQVWTG